MSTVRRKATFKTGTSVNLIEGYPLPVTVLGDKIPAHALYKVVGTVWHGWEEWLVLSWGGCVATLYQAYRFQAFEAIS